ncbi:MULTISPECIES: hypothetical protein [Bacillus]|nr:MULTISPECIES: hypothetical protein [Bacillus]MEC1504322.1 hypothetical protein [Bacillus haynesii]
MLEIQQIFIIAFRFVKGGPSPKPEDDLYKSVQRIDRMIKTKD